MTNYVIHFFLPSGLIKILTEASNLTATCKHTNQIKRNLHVAVKFDASESILIRPKEETNNIIFHVI
jgi:hypothetical protein